MIPSTCLGRRIGQETGLTDPVRSWSDDAIKDLLLISLSMRRTAVDRRHVKEDFGHSRLFSGAAKVHSVSRDGRSAT